MLKRLLILSVVFILCTHFGLKLSSSLNTSANEPTKFYIGEPESSPIESAPNPDNPYVFSAFPSFDQPIKTQVKIDDARPEIIRQYLNRFKSPLEPYAQLIVDLSDQYDFDYRWLVAIAQQESNLCKKIPENSYNCWGWGIYGDKVTRFDNFEDALRRIAPQFTKIFLQGKHYKDPMEVMRTYTPPSDGSWANGVSTFFSHLE